MNCPNCGTPANPGSKFCIACGSPLSEQSSLNSSSGWICHQCGSRNPDDVEYCTNCGTQRKKKGSNQKPVLIGIGVVLAVLLLYFGASFLFPDTIRLPGGLQTMVHGEDSEKVDPEAIDYEDVEDRYEVLIKSEGFQEPFSSEKSDTDFRKDAVITITQLAGMDDSEEVWGKIGSSWVKIRDKDGEYLKKLEETAKSPEKQPAKSENSTKQKEDSTPSKKETAEKSAPSRQLTASYNVPVRGSVREKEYYTGPALVQSILDMFSISQSQTTLAAKLNTEASQVTSYLDMAALLTSELRDHGISNVRYDGVYYDAPISSSQEQELLGYLEKNSKDGYPTIVHISPSELMGVDKTCFALIYGMSEYSDGTESFRIYFPFTEDSAFEISSQDLLRMMEATGDLCYVH